MKPRLPVFLSLLTLLLFSCVADDLVPSGEAQKRIFASYLAKMDFCDQPGSLLFFVPKNVMESELLTCEDSILAAPCPLEEIPPACLLLAFP